MTVIVVFPDGTDQVMSNWYYRQIKEDVLMAFPDDQALCEEIACGGAVGLLDMSEVDREMQDKILRAMRFVTELTLDYGAPGWLQDWPEDEAGVFSRTHLDVLAKLDRNIARFIPRDTAGIGVRLRRFMVRIVPLTRGRVRDFLYATRRRRRILTWFRR